MRQKGGKLCKGVDLLTHISWENEQRDARKPLPRYYGPHSKLSIDAYC